MQHFVNRGFEFRNGLRTETFLYTLDAMRTCGTWVMQWLVQGWLIIMCHTKLAILLVPAGGDENPSSPHTVTFPSRLVPVNCLLRMITMAGYKEGHKLFGIDVPMAPSELYTALILVFLFLPAVIVVNKIVGIFVPSARAPYDTKKANKRD